MELLQIPSMKIISAIDTWLYLFVGRFQERLRLYFLARVLSFTGDGYLYFAVALFLLWQNPQQGVLITIVGVVAFAIELPLYFVLKRLFKRRRPFVAVPLLDKIYEPSDEFSFPSGHTTAGFLMAYILSYFFPAITLFVYIWASLIGLSRVMLRVHYVTDIFAGMILGTGVSMLSLVILGYPLFE